MRGPIEARIASLSDQLVRIEPARQELIHRLAEIEAACGAIRIERSLLRNQLLPISSFTNEVLSRIFRISSDVCVYSGPGSNENDIRAEVLMSHVSKRWRDVALATPALWTRIHRRNFQSALEPIVVYLQRSRRLPIHILVEIGCPRSDDDELRDDILPFLALIRTHLSRCVRLFVESQNCEEERKLFEWLASQSAPVLSSLRISLSYKMHRQPLRILEGGAQSLTHIYLDRVAPLHYQPPIGNVTTLHLDLTFWLRNYEECQQLSHMLSVMPSLTRLELVNAKYWHSGVHILLPALRTLSHVVDNLAEASPLLLTLKAPSLLELAIRVSTIKNCDKTLAVHGPSNFPSLQRLYVHTLEINASNLRTLSRAFPFLVELTFTNLWNIGLHFTALLKIMEEDHSMDEDAVPWSRLQTLAIATSYVGGSAVPMLRDFLECRAQMGWPILKLLLPNNFMAKGKEISADTTCPAVIEEFPGNRPSPFLNW